MKRFSRLMIFLSVNFGILATSVSGWLHGVSHGLILGTAIVVAPLLNLFVWFLLRLRDETSGSERSAASPRKRSKLWVHLAAPVIGVLCGLAVLGMGLADESTSAGDWRKKGVFATGMGVLWILIVLRRYKRPTESVNVDERDQRTR